VTAAHEPANGINETENEQEPDMKDVFSIATFAAGALGLALFVTILKPDSIPAAPAPTKASSCHIGRSGLPGRGLNVLAAMSAADLGRFARS
jgi:hypothetical protein